MPERTGVKKVSGIVRFASHREISSIPNTNTYADYSHVKQNHNHQFGDRAPATA